jgi:chromatin structure-remodeling complex subunit RSC1/2
MNMSRARGPKYSLEYLTFLATKKRKQREAGTDMDGREELRDEGSSSAKRPRMGFPPTVTETMRELWNDMRADGFTI